MFLGQNRSELDHTAKIALTLLSVILATTTHTQDFPDVEGDRLVGRKTIPIVLPDISRYTPFAIMVPWSFCLSSVWKADLLVQIVLVGLAIITGYRYFRWRRAEDDRLSFLMYNVGRFTLMLGACTDLNLRSGFRLR
jgi:4-hydroxybenzoate polyprenyltransferase